MTPEELRPWWQNPQASQAKELRPWWQNPQASQVEGFQRLQDSLSDPPAVQPKDYAPAGAPTRPRALWRALVAKLTGRADR